MGLFDLVVENSGGLDYLRIIIASGSEKPYYLSKLGMSPRGCYLRVGSASEPMPVKMIEELFARRVRAQLGTI